MQQHFHQYFNARDIIKLICKYRLKYSDKRHKLHLLADISFSNKIKGKLEKSTIPAVLKDILPSRRSWCRPLEKYRKKSSNSKKIWEHALIRTIQIEHVKTKQDPNYESAKWYLNLRSFISKVQERANNPQIPIGRPIIKPIPKNKLRVKAECRPISIYELEDRIIISLTAKYFTELFDDKFSESSFAFRAVKKILNGRTVKTHHDTISTLLSFRETNNGKDFFVAECDIKKFFDCVNHQTVLNILDEDCASNSIELNENAREIFKQYLKSYSFSEDVFPLNQTTYFDEHNLPQGWFKWDCMELKRGFYVSDSKESNLSDIEIGIPQGGALSCFISNLMLNRVDKELNKLNSILYMRFCDDMIIVTTNEGDCVNALSIYKEQIAKLKLLIHEPKEISKYSKKFWSVKSKKTYKWGNPQESDSNVPWVSFVGYQVKFDGSVRVRKKSLIKEMEKQGEECKHILKALELNNSLKDINDVSRKSKKQQLFALENRLISMSVGRVKLYDRLAPPSLCWTNGFKALNQNQTSVRQLRLLDRNRSLQLFKVKKAIKSLSKPTDNPEHFKEKKFYGSPYSYHSLILRITKSEQPT